ncbi:MAG TPA: DNA mismatch repair endonuclease MutL [Myxococcota bacterium]|nr:DNA mismatch repair endonuclease MutL [Myxococcota bacterium]
MSDGPQGAGTRPEGFPRETTSAPRIRRLPEDLIDQIAAGEVVERPASVAKELVENAVDAGARRIRVEVRDGGRSLVAVTDDGCGMGREDARLALERHATSKLGSASDLERIRSFGFRGEALPAIASVSRFRLRTRAAADAEGTELTIAHGRDLAVRAAGGPIGTRIEVADLFEALPARRKFLKAATTEWTHLADWLARAALALPEIHFDVSREGKPAWSWPATTDRLARVAAVLSEREAEALLPAELEREGLHLRAYVSRPDAHRRTADGLYLYVNGRPVRDRLLRHALLEAYRDWLPRGRYPTAILELALPPEAVDVNVHPAKWEVRFAEPGAIHRLVSAVVRRAIEARGWLAQGAERAPHASPPLTSSAPASFAVRDGASAPAPGDWILAQDVAETARPLSAEPGPAIRFADLRPLGQLLGSYLLLEDKRGLLLVDQHAAHERVLYERMRASWVQGGVERQALLVPATVELDATAHAAVEASAPQLERFGFEVEPFGATAVLVRAVPALLGERDPAVLLRGLADELASGTLASGAASGAGEGASVRLLESADKLFASLACHGARRAGDVLPPGEQRALLDALDAIPWAPTCPHGRPVAIPLPLAEIERRFGR